MCALLLSLMGNVLCYALGDTTVKNEQREQNKTLGRMHDLLEFAN